jgi:WD40 repeat protein
MSTRLHLRRLLAASGGVCALVLVLASSASVAGRELACDPHPGLGVVALARGGKLHTIDLETCHERVVRTGVRGQVHFDADGLVHVVPRSAALRSPGERYRATVRVTGKRRTLRNAIWVTDLRTGRSRSVFSAGAWGDTAGLDSPGPIVLLGWSGDDRWIFFAIDPGGSGSIAADGLILQVVSVSGGAPHKLAVMLAYPDYIRWCGGQLVFTAGRDRIATNDKRLLVTAPPRWRTRPLVRDEGRAWGSLACSADERSLVVQSQPESRNASFFATRWSLWRVGLDGSKRRLTSPPRGYADESPRFSRDGGTILFVRSRKGVGELDALRDGEVLGPLLSLRHSLGWYGHQDWWQTMDWSLGVRR